MKRKGIIIGIIIALALGGGIVYRFTHLTTGGGEHKEEAGHNEAGHKEEKAGGHEEGKEHTEGKEGHEGHDEHGEIGSVTMTAEVQKQNGVVVAPAKKQRLAGVISATGKVEANADRIAHVSPRISGKIVAVKASLGDSVASGQSLATLDSVELGEALNRYRQSKTKLALAQSNMDRIKALVEKKIAARKDIFQAETDYKTAQTELHTDEERLLLYGISASELKGDSHKKPLCGTSPIGGSLRKTCHRRRAGRPVHEPLHGCDLSSVWVLVDISERDWPSCARGTGNGHGRRKP